MRLLLRDRLDDDSSAPEEGIELTAPAVSGLSFNYDCCFYEAGCRNATGFCLADGARIPFGVVLIEQDCEQR
jgi:hypothetical protein